ncbi:MAG: phosphatidylinositol kinase, partial [Actinobacteria bacterium]|nr:phosphatidylinositol kinase [Actinomycetota bacterium]
MTDSSGRDMLEIVGQMSNASNATLLVKDSNAQYIYKPVSGERPLWDFPDGTLANRERAAYLTSELLGWNL